MKNIKQLTAPCGLACFACSLFSANITEEIAKQVASRLGINPEDVPCDGCRSARGCSFEMPLTGGKGCPTKQCADEKGVHNCSECAEFPCSNLMPTASMADQVPHNTKMYNLARIKLIGLEAWAEEAAAIQQKYFLGRFVYGSEPSLDEA